MDLVIKGGTVVTPGASLNADIGVRDGKVAQIGGEMAADRVIDARGKLVIPGGVDMHVHLHPSYPLRAGSPPRMVDDFYAGTAGAAAGGVTTVGSMTSPQFGEENLTLMARLERVEADASANAVIDFTLHAVLTDPSPAIIAELPEAAKRGYTSIKIFLMRRIFDDRTADYFHASEVAARNGMLTMVHCEDASINAYREQRLVAQGRGSARYYPDSRPRYGEAVATARAIAMGRAVEAPLYVVHLSCAGALEEVRRARARGQAIYVETRPIYLYLTRERYEEPDGAKYVSAPPLREQSDRDALWQGLRAGDVDTFCSDHAPWTLAQKLDPELTLGSYRAGMSNLETLMPMLYSEGVRKGRISLNRWVELTSTNAAKLFGMFPQKGAIAVGSDADLVVWDPDRRRTIRASEMRSNAGYDVYEGREVHGWPAYTISRGEIVVEDGKVTGARGRGRRVRRGPYMPL